MIVTFQLLIVAPKSQNKPLAAKLLDKKYPITQLKAIVACASFTGHHPIWQQPRVPLAFWMDGSS